MFCFIISENGHVQLLRAASFLNCRWRPDSRRILCQVRLAFSSITHSYQSLILPLLFRTLRFSEQATSLNVSATDLYNALLADAEDQPPNWDLQGRQANIWKILGFIPDDIFEASGTNTKQVSRTLEVRCCLFHIRKSANDLAICSTLSVTSRSSRLRNF